MTFSSAWGKWGFSTLCETFVNDSENHNTFRVVKIVKDLKSGNEISRSNELLAVPGGKTQEICQNANNGTQVIFRVFKRDYDTTGQYTETKILDETYNAPLAPNGPR